MPETPLRKAIVCLGIGGPYEAQLRATAPFREYYAKKHGWDVIDITSLHPRAAAELQDLPFALRTHLSKLLVPSELRSRYDLVLFVEADTFLHPQAPCISALADFIPAGGFAAVADHLVQERLPLFGWQGDHYGTLSKDWSTDLPALTEPDRAVNGGVQLYRPEDVADRWLQHFAHHGGNHDENLLNLRDVQQGLVYFLPTEWNRIWFYEKFRMGFLKPATGLYSRVRNHLVNRVLWRMVPTIEKRAFRRHFPVAHIHHLAFEGTKVVEMAEYLLRFHAEVRESGEQARPGDQPQTLETVS